MNVIGKELKLFFLVGLVMMLGMQVGFHVNKTLGLTIVYLCFPVAAYAFFKGQIKFFKKLRESKKDSPSDSSSS